MSEQAPTQSNEEYLAHHPDAITDPAKAEYMAHVSKTQEEMVVELGHDALQHTILAESPEQGFLDDYMIGGGSQKMRRISQEAMEGAISARERADQQAAEAGQQYDFIQALKRGQTPKREKTNAFDDF